MRGKHQRLGLIGLLYVSQAIPLGFFIVAVPAILRSRGVSLEHVGLLSAIALPWLIKFLWAPLVDRYGSTSRGHYRSWLLPLQVLCVLCVLAMALIGPRMGWLVAVGALFMLLSATQDIAVDGLAVRSLSFDERGPGNGVQVGGYYLGQVLGGGVVLVLFSQFGWTLSLLAMAAFLALPLIPTLRYREAKVAAPPERVGFAAIASFLKRSGGTWLLVCLLYRSAEMMAFTMIQPMLVDQGFSLAQIGVLIGTAGSIASLSGAVLGGALMLRVGRKGALVAFGLLQAATISGLTVLGGSGVHPGLTYSLILAAAFSGGMATAALYTNMMDRAEANTAATDFTCQQSICAIGPLTAAAVSGFSAAAFGYGGHFVVCAVLQVAVVVLILRWLGDESAVTVSADAG